MPKLTISQTDVNRLAQTFYEASGITLRSMSDKPVVVKGLKAVFEELGIEVEKPAHQNCVLPDGHLDSCLPPPRRPLSDPQGG